MLVLNISRFKPDKGIYKLAQLETNPILFGPDPNVGLDPIFRKEMHDGI